MSEEEAGDAPQERSGCAGAIVLTVLVLALAVVLFAASREAFILVFWGGAAAGLLFWQARKVPPASNSAPPTPSERGCEEEPQVTTIRDPSHPNRWLIIRPSEWLSAGTDKETGTSS